MIQLPNYEEREAFKKAQKAKILSAFNQETQGAPLISKAEFVEKFPIDKYETYTLKSIDNFRQQISKAEDIEDKDAAFKQATKGLKHFVVTEGDNKNIVFVREKEKGE